MEVGDQTVDAVELHPRVQEDGGVAAASLDLAVLGSGSLQCAAAGSAHSDDPVACGLGLADAPGGLLADGVPLAVHLMVGDLVLLHRSEGAQTNVQGDLGNADPHGADGVHQLRGKVQPGGGSSCAAQLLGIDGLVLALILQLLCDVGRQRHLTKFIQLFIKRFGIIIECNVLVAVLHGLVHHGGQTAVAKAHLCAGLHPLAGLCQALPLVSLHLSQQQQLAHGTGRLLDAHDAGGQHLGIIHYQKISRLQKFRQVAEYLVLDAVVLLAQNHQPCRIPRGRRFLCNELFG